MNKEIQGVYDDTSIIVYHAYPKGIAVEAVKNQTFGNRFKMDRMTWIKSSFLWMMYRCGWTEKENQEYVLQLRLKEHPLII